MATNPTENIEDAIWELAKTIGKPYSDGEMSDIETVNKAASLIGELRQRLPAPEVWCYVCDRPRLDCACVEKDGTY